MTKSGYIPKSTNEILNMLASGSFSIPVDASGTTAGEQCQKTEYTYKTITVAGEAMSVVDTITEYYSTYKLVTQMEYDSDGNVTKSSDTRVPI